MKLKLYFRHTWIRCVSHVKLKYFFLDISEQKGLQGVIKPVINNGKLTKYQQKKIITHQS